MHATSRPVIDHAFVAVVPLLIFLQATGIGFGGETVTIVACVAMLAFGLPHGTLDLKLIARHRRTDGWPAPAVLALYLALAASAFVAWRISPLMALAVFIVVAIVHFAEDWPPFGSRFLSHGMATAVIAAPSVFWRDDVRGLFIALAGNSAAGTLADLLLMVAPVSLIVAAVALAGLWIEGSHDEALTGVTVLAAMIALPPAVGFAVFFCLFHSPRHFRAALAELSLRRFTQWRRVVLLLTATALAGTLGMMFLDHRTSAVDSVVAASFMTLSILTIPHMLVPVIVSKLRPWAALNPGASRPVRPITTVS